MIRYRDIITYVLFLPFFQIYAQTKVDFENREVACFSIELNSIISNEGKTKYGIEGYKIDKDDIVKKYKNSLNKSISSNSADVKKLKSFEMKKDIVITGLAEVTKETVPFSSIILEPLQKYVEYEREERIKQYENIKINNIKKSIVEGLDKIISNGNISNLKEIINGDTPLFEFDGSKIIYNKKLTEAVLKIGEVERKKIDNVFETQRKDIETLYNQQATAMKRIANVETMAIYSFQRNKEVILENSKKIEANALDIQENNRLIKQNAFRVSILEATIVNHEVRISRNTEEIENIKLSMLWDRASLEDKIKGLKDKTFDYLFTNKNGVVDESAKSDLIRDSENLKTRKDISEIAKNTSDWGKVASQLLSDVDPELAKVIDKGVELSNIVGNYALGNYPAAAMGAMSFVGIGGKSVPSQETILMKQMMKELNSLRKQMHERFDYIDKNLEEIKNEIYDVQDYLYKMNNEIRLMHNKTINELNFIKEDLEKIKTMVGCSQDLEIDGRFQGLYVCELPQETIKNSFESGNINSYSDFLNVIEASECEECIKGLKRFISSGEKTKKVFQFTECDTRNSAIPTTEMYNLMLGFWKKKWSKNYVSSFNSLFYPPKYNLKNLAFIHYKNDNEIEKLKSFVNFKKIYDEQLLSTEKLKLVTDYFLNLYPILESYNLNKGFKTFEKSIGIRYNIEDTPNVKFISYILELIDYSIGQQTLMSGHLMVNEYIKKLYTGTSKEVEDLQKILRDNPIVLHNIINNIIAINYDDLLNDKTKIIIDKTDNLIIELDKTNQDNWLLKIERENLYNGDNRGFNILQPIKPITETDRNPEFLLSPDFFELLELRKKLVHKRTEINFIKSLQTIDSKFMNSEDFKKLLITNNYGNN